MVENFSENSELIRLNREVIGQKNHFPFQSYAVLFPDRFLNIGDQGFHIGGGGPAAVDDEIGVMGGDLGVAYAPAFKAALVDEPAGAGPLGGVFKDAAAGEFFGGEFGPALPDDRRWVAANSRGGACSRK